MRNDQLLVLDLSAALLALTVSGLLQRNKARLCWSFLAYLMSCLIGNRLLAFWPERFYTVGFWSLKETVYSVLKVCIALEIAWLTFSQFPRAQRRAIVLFALVAFATAWAIVTAPQGDSYEVLLGFVQPMNQVGALWLFIAVLGLSIWHYIPLHRAHRAIVWGFALYLGFSGPLLSIVRVVDWDVAYPILAALDPPAFAATVGVWCWAAWRPTPAIASDPVMRRLQPWAVS